MGTAEHVWLQYNPRFIGQIVYISFPAWTSCFDPAALAHSTAT